MYLLYTFLVGEFIVLCSGWGEGLDNVNTPQIGSSWRAAMQLGYPGHPSQPLVQHFIPCLVLNSQLPQLMLAVRAVARGWLPPHLQHTQQITERSAVGKGHQRSSSK